MSRNRSDWRRHNIAAQSANSSRFGVRWMNAEELSLSVGCRTSHNADNDSRVSLTRLVCQRGTESNVSWLCVCVYIYMIRRQQLLHHLSAIRLLIKRVEVLPATHCTPDRHTHTPERYTNNNSSQSEALLQLFPIIYHPSWRIIVLFHCACINS